MRFDWLLSEKAISMLTGYKNKRAQHWDDTKSEEKTVLYKNWKQN